MAGPRDRLHIAESNAESYSAELRDAGDQREEGEMIIRDTETRRDEWRRSVLLMLAQRYLFGFLVFVVLFSGVELFRHSASAAAHALPWLPISRQLEVKQKPAQVLPASTAAEAQQKALQTMQEEIITLKLWVVDEAIKILGIVFAVVRIVTTLLGVGGIV